MINKYYKAYIFIAFFLIATEIFAGGPPGAGNRPPGPPGLPIDGGVIALFVIATGFAIKKINDISKK